MLRLLAILLTILPTSGIWSCDCIHDLIELKDKHIVEAHKISTYDYLSQRYMAGKIDALAEAIEIISKSDNNLY